MKLNVVDNFSEQIYDELVKSRKELVDCEYNDIRKENILNTIILIVAVVVVSLTFGFIARFATSIWIPFLVDLAICGVVIVGAIIRHMFIVRDIINERSKAESGCADSKTKSLHEFYINNGELQLDHFHAGSVVLVGRDARSFTIDSNDVNIVISDIPMTLKFDTNNIALYVQKGVN